MKLTEAIFLDFCIIFAKFRALKAYKLEFKNFLT